MRTKLLNVVNSATDQAWQVFSRTQGSGAVAEHVRPQIQFLPFGVRGRNVLRVGIPLNHLLASADALGRAAARCLALKGLAVELHQHAVIDVATEHALGALQMGIVAVAGEFEAITEAQPQVIHGTNGALAFTLANVPRNHELGVDINLTASGARPVRDLIANLDGCTGAKAGEIVAAARLGRTICRDVTHAQAERLLRAAREQTKQVTPGRLGWAGAIFQRSAYAIAYGTATFGEVAPFAKVPYVVEAWAKPEKGKEAKTGLFAYVNRTPVTGDIEAGRDKRKIDAYGCGLSHTIPEAPAERQFTIQINMAATLVGRRANNAASQGRCLVPCSLAWRITASAPAVNKLRR
jgi:hypothetical protein